ncbi:MAG: DNA-processing protein DprA [Clostridiales bacterium]|nr:DNA-processing protein DprA [Clostridiales bacterium]MDD7036199.1 DNA-processing protein DprA [Bacillota bacterium]MDY2920736.1 DNA-processing protein DprA [Lentihominibacter sp.]
MNEGVVTRDMAEYPPLLREIKNSPERLYYTGDISLLSRRCVAVVGSRTVTPYGRNVAESIGRKLGEHGITVVSGMARGIDSFAHKGALRAGGNTAAVFAGGTDVCYPAENRNLKAEIERKGVIVSEQPPGKVPEKYDFPLRNRIISGLCEMTIVVQARNRSGALITAELAEDQGRRLMAVPGNIDSEYNLGNNKIIREGVMPVVSIDDILHELGISYEKPDIVREKLSSTEYQVYELLRGRGEMSIDELCILMDKPPGYVNRILSVLEMKGLVFSEIGKIFLANR